MGELGLKKLGVERDPDHTLFIYSEMGVGHPQTCMMDGLQASTGATYGKLSMERLNWGKVAAIIFHPEKGAVRIAVRNEFQTMLSKYEFFAYRKRSIEPSQIPEDVCKEVIQLVFDATEEEMFKITRLPDFKYSRVKGSFAKDVCEECGEFVFERYLRIKDGKTVCIQCSGYDPAHPKEQ
jgi:formylmethanofuran dehydrogenase subunit E